MLSLSRNSTFTTSLSLPSPFRHPTPTQLSSSPPTSSPPSTPPCTCKHPWRSSSARSAASRRLVVVHDVLMSYAGHAVASVDNAESYAFHCTPAFYGLSLMWEEGERPATDLSREVLDVISTRLDGCYPGEFWEHVDRSTFDTPKQAGLLVNTCRAIEGEFLDLIAGGYVPDGERLFAVGPVNPVAAYERLGDEKRHKCLDWLDRHDGDGGLCVVRLDDDDIRRPDRAAGDRAAAQQPAVHMGRPRRGPR
ncbi:cis-zeatin O-glucosyltransferase 2 [Iris pallida]|uniref:Cis-zeatin O-glucosyltransferase 2 n=1 Tax=Iris pallida TaxID=29817 RepID=A0AAX6H7Z7_IRIPA|nr:cis-zeatin O-glucosyltransferase 2 [Iris pallida]